MFLLKENLFSRFLFYCEIYVVLRKKEKNYFIKIKWRYMYLNYIKNGKPIYRLKIFFGKCTKL